MNNGNERLACCTNKEMSSESVSGETHEYYGGPP